MGHVRSTALLTLGLMAGCGEHTPDTGAAEAALQARAREIHASVLTIDTHDDIPFDFATDAVDPLDAPRQVNLEKMVEGGLDAAFFVVYVPQDERSVQGHREASVAAVTKFEAIHRMAEQLYPDRIELAYTADDVERIHAEGKLVAVIAVENGYVLGEDLGAVERYYDMGGRYLTLTHNGHNDVADSAAPRSDLGDDDAEHHGLSPFGEQVVAEMNRVGMMVDVSHVSKAAALAAIRASRAPVIASHSSVGAVLEHPRNLDDETLHALADAGGVVQIVAVPHFLATPAPGRAEALAELQEAMGVVGGSTQGMSHQQKFDYEQGLVDLDVRYPPPDVAVLVDHVDAAVERVGIDHVGISSDFDGGGGIHGWNDASESFNVTLELVRRGYGEEEIGKLWGGNLLRVWREAERVAAESQ